MPTILCLSSLLFGTSSVHAYVLGMDVLPEAFLALTVISTMNHALSSRNNAIRVIDWTVAHCLFVYQMYVAILYAQNCLALWVSWICGFEIVRVFHVMGIYKNDNVLMHGWMHVVCV